MNTQRKLVAVGDSECGKTCLLLQFLNTERTISPLCLIATSLISKTVNAEWS